jgi:hypothetical protein
MTLTVNSANFTGSVDQVAYSFYFYLEACVVNSFAWTKVILDTNYMINVAWFKQPTFWRLNLSLLAIFQ